MASTPAEPVYTSELEKADAKAVAKLADEEFLAKHGYGHHWGATRIRLAQILNHPICDIAVGIVVIFNFVVVVIETDEGADKYAARSPWIETANHGMLFFYTCELCLRLYTFRWAYFRSGLNRMDFTLVSVDWALLLPFSILQDFIPVSFLRVFRLARLARSHVIMEFSPELALMIQGLRDTAKTLFWGAILIFFMLTVWSIVAVAVIHPLNLEVAEQTDHYDGCVRCARAYESVFQSNLTLFQSLIAGDSWGMVTIPVMEHKPVTAIYFIGVQFTISIGVMNLLLAVIVDRAGAARAADVATLEAEEQEEGERLKARLEEICQEMDGDNSGQITLPEILTGYKSHHDFRLTMKAMDIEEDDMKQVFHMLDKDQSGTVLYSEFAEQVWKMKSIDDHTMLLFLKFSMSEVKQQVDISLSLLRQEMAVLNTHIGSRIIEPLEGLTSQFADHRDIIEPLTSLTDQIAIHIGGSSANLGDLSKSKPGYPVPISPAKVLQVPEKWNQSLELEIAALRAATEETAKTLKQHFSALSQQPQQLLSLPRYAAQTLPSHQSSSWCGVEKAAAHPQLKLMANQ